MSQPIRITVTAAILLLIGSALLFGDDKKSEKSPPTVDVIDPIQKGAKELALLTGFGLSHEIWDGVGETRFLILGVRLGKVLSGPRGPGFLNGNLEVSGEFLPVYLVDEGETAYGVSATLLGRHFLMAGSRWRPYLMLGFGLLCTADPIPQDSSHINFTPQMGLGLSYSYNQQFIFYTEYRLQHISNATIGLKNPGINSSYFQFGMSLYRW